MKKIIRYADAVIAAVIILIFSAIGFGEYSLPEHIYTDGNAKVSFNQIYSLSSKPEEQVDLQSSRAVSQSRGEIKLLGIIPVKEAEISPSDSQRVILGGESFGIKLYTDGVMVVGTKDVQTDGGMKNPSKEAGIEKGDIIVSINGEKTNTADSVEKLLNDNNGKAYKVKIKRNGNYKTFSVKPVYSKSEGCYKVGLWVRDSTAGVGTTTFYNKKNNTLAALGHPITDVDTNEIIPILEGEAVEAQVTNIYKSTDGDAGSLNCDFTDKTIANLKTNSVSGIYGVLSREINKDRELEVAPSCRVKKGYAQVVCTVDNNSPQAYDAEIVRVSYRQGQVKNMVVKITDERLLNITGGIVQGMSGSPIIQDGRLAGALTHVIVDNPRKGYAIFAETMLRVSNTVK